MGIFLPENQTAGRNRAESAPLRRFHAENLIQQLLRHAVAFWAHAAPVAVQELRRTFFVDCMDQRRRRAQYVQWLKTGDRQRDTVIFRQETPRFAANNGADVTRSENCVNLGLTAVQNGADRRGREFVQAQHAEVGHTFGLGLQHGGSDAWRRRFEAHAQKYNLAGRVLPRQCHRVGGRVDDAHVRALSASVLQGSPAARYAQHIPKCG